MTHTLFNQPPAQRHSHTSVEAAERIKPDTATLRAQVFGYIREHGGATDMEIQAGLRMDGNTERPRRVELVDMGLVCASAETRRTKAGRKATVWVATGERR